MWPWVCAAMPTSSLVLPTVGRGDASPLRRTTTLRSVASSGSLRRRVAPGRPELAVGGRGAAAATVDFRQLTEPSLENREPLCWRFIFLPKWHSVNSELGNKCVRRCVCLRHRWWSGAFWGRVSIIFRCRWKPDASELNPSAK